MTDGIQDPFLRALATGTLGSLWAKRHPDAVAVRSGQGDRTHAQLNERANRLARALRARGLRPGDGVALLCTNRPEFVEVLAAAQRTGLRFTPINWHLTADEIGYIVRDSQARAFIADARLAALAAETYAALAAETHAPAAHVRLALGGDIAGFEAYEAVLTEQDGSDLPDPCVGSSMLYTSGTTGRPKGVHRATSAAAAGAAQTLAREALAATPYRPGEDLHLTTGPLYHAAPLAYSLVLPLMFGAGIVLMEGWDAEETLRLIDRHRISHTHMVPTMFHRLLSLPQEVRDAYDVSSLRSVWHGAAPCPVPVKQALIGWLGPIVWEYYGATEGVGCLVDSPSWLERPGTVGRPEDGHIRILDSDGSEQPAGTAGTIYLRAPDVGRFEYFQSPEKTESAYRGDYFTLGDIGYLDADGWLYLTDRSANLIISGGVNIYPAEVEAVLLEHPAVGDVGVIGVPNDEWGEEVKAVVELQPGLTPTVELADELLAFTRGRLAAFKCPRSVEFVDVLPRQDNGKLYKEQLRAEYRARAVRG